MRLLLLCLLVSSCGLSVSDKNKLIRYYQCYCEAYHKSTIQSLEIYNTSALVKCSKSDEFRVYFYNGKYSDECGKLEL